VAAIAPSAPAAPPIREVARSFALHLTALYIPGVVLVFLWTGPHPWYLAPAFMLPLVLAHQIDCGPARERKPPLAGLPAWPFDALVYVLAGLQFWIVIETVRLFSVQGIFSLDMAMTYLIVGGASGFSIITAHELIHRRSRAQQALGRLLLCTVLYEHFYTEHLRGHHVRVGTPDDPATARFGEGFEAFFRRTVPAQLRSAWRLEKRRLGDADMRLWDRRMIRNRMLHGLLVEWGLAFGILAGFGLAAFVAFLVQAFSAVRLLEAVNYFEHWGLRRNGPRVQPVDSWDTHAWFTYYGLIGLSRHADHHAYPARPYTQLRVFDEAPQLPYGYVGMVDLVLAKDAEFHRLAAVELGRRRLGPFAAPAGGAADAAAPVEAEAALARLAESQHGERRRSEPGVLGRAWRRVPGVAKAALVLGALILVLSVGVQWEGGAARMDLFERLVANSWILAVFAGVIWLRERLETRIQHETLAWSVALALLAAVGAATAAVWA
jgi:alkane 1-monooxygenase